MNMRHFFGLGCITLLFPAGASADRTRYYRTVDLQADSSHLIARHPHQGTDGAIWNITLEECDTGHTTVIPDVPASTYLWIARASNLWSGDPTSSLKRPD
ncbi:hypothetical protein Q4S45_07435 [Massilia sp. R2A-15]|uniref:hypothetical protein n=1 Tax=Massilia sp. R2A-15 TaxID=3064278 RepID=UPI002732DB9C|nr:hypothetical protein [Massilia sp. R2A-15]WLI90940.1 hypothetical protein Q4S45_07435 [Massilia sp. R2A-15]